MHFIKKEPVNADNSVLIDKNPWNYMGYDGKAYAKITYDDTGFNVNFTVFEKNPLREKTKHFEPVNEDSCVEFFVNFTPEKSDRYINFEVNANGAMNVAFRKDRFCGTNLALSDIESLNIKTKLFDDKWQAKYKIPFDFIKKYYPDFDIAKAEYVKGNLYKCGDKTKVEHYLSYFDIKTKTPDFHRPEYFGVFNIEK